MLSEQIIRRIETRDYTISAYKWKTVRVKLNTKDMEEPTDIMIDKIYYDTKDVTKSFTHVSNIQKEIWRGIPDKLFEDAFSQLYYQVFREIEYCLKLEKIREKILNVDNYTVK